MSILPQFNHSGTFASRNDVKYHSHSGIELILLTKGSCTINVGTATLHGKHGTLFILPEAIEHNQLNSGTVYTIYTTFKYPYFNQTPRTIQMEKDSLIKTWLQQIHALNFKTEKHKSKIISGILYAIINHISASEKTEYQRKSFPASLCKALELIERAPEKSISLPELARQSTVSSSYLISLFNNHVGCSPTAYSMELKMKMAEYLLHDPYLSIKQVARRCGFMDMNYFCRQFRQHHGFTATEYRQKTGLN